MQRTTTTISIGGSLQFANRNNPAKKYLNAFLLLIPSISKTVEYTTDFTMNILFKPGDTVYPIQVATRRWRSGVYRGGYFKLDADQACSIQGEENGHWYIQSNERSWGTWSDNLLEHEWSTYVVNGHVGQQFLKN